MKKKEEKKEDNPSVGAVLAALAVGIFIGVLAAVALPPEEEK